MKTTPKNHHKNRADSGAISIAIQGITLLCLATPLTGCPDLHRPWKEPQQPPLDPGETPPPSPTPRPTPQLGEACDGESKPTGVCTAGINACAVGGPLVCVDGIVACSATALAPERETCGTVPVDEDCDGRFDEGLACCRDGTTRAAETCDRQDNDCDGRVDEDAGCCHPQANGETCNGADDDCDGTIDEDFLDLGEACTATVGVCSRPGRWRCHPTGAHVACEALDATVGIEDGTCDGTDDDCDGKIDNAPPCNGAAPNSIIMQPGFDALGLIDHPWVFIPPQEYTRGTDDPRAFEHEGPPHRVRLTRTVMVATNEVTIGQWRALTGTEPSLRTGCDDCPVERISWYEAAHFANLVTDWRKQWEPDLTRCYDLGDCLWEQDFGAPCPDNDAERHRCVSRFSCPQATYDRECTGYRLLTEAEWEAATRAGTDTLYWFGDGDDDLPAHENCNARGNATEEVLARPANAYGLRHTLGNVGEWVFDEVNAYPSPPPPLPWSDPITQSTEHWQFDAGPERVYRGQSPHAVIEFCHSTGRRVRRPVIKDFEMGVRLARTLPEE